MDLQLDLGSFSLLAIARLKSKEEAAEALARERFASRHCWGPVAPRRMPHGRKIDHSTDSSGLLNSLDLLRGELRLRWAPSVFEGPQLPRWDPQGLPRCAGGLSGAARLGEGGRWEARQAGPPPQAIEILQESLL